MFRPTSRSVSTSQFAAHSRLLLLSAVAASAFLTVGPVCADPTTPLPSVALPAPAPTAKVVLPERTEVRVRLQEELKSGNNKTGNNKTGNNKTGDNKTGDNKTGDNKTGDNKTGEEVPFVVAADVYGPGHLLMIPAGTNAYGKVTQSSRRGIFGKAGKLNFTCEYVLTADGTHIPLRSDPLEHEGSSNTGAAVAVAILLTPFGLLINGKDITVHKGEEFNMYVNENTMLTPPYNASAAPSAPAPAAAGKSLFSLKGGEQIVGVITSFDGAAYVVATDQGARKIAAAEIKSIYSLK